MRRRQLLRAGLAVGATTALAGCFGKAPPPRKSNVVTDISVQDGTQRMNVADDVWVQSRAEYGAQGEMAQNGLSPIGVAAAAKGGGGGGRGATGRASGGYSSAPHTGKGRAKYHGGAYADDWRDEHDDEIERYPAEVVAVGMAYFGSDAQFRDELPGAGPVDDWDQLKRDPGDTVTFDVVSAGWYRVGFHLNTANGNHDLGWECVDYEVDRSGGSFTVENPWKVSPRL